jgi:hypothetical protein
LADGIKKLFGGGPDGTTFFIFEFEHAGKAVAGEMEDVIGVALDGVSDDGWMADFENADFNVFEELGRLNSVEDVLEFAFEIEDGKAGSFVFIRRADGDEDFDGAGEEGRAGCVETGHTAIEHDVGVESDRAGVWEAEGFEGEGEKSGVGGFETDFDGCAERRAIEDGREGGSGVAGETEGAEFIAEDGEVGFERGALSFGGAADAGGEAAEEIVTGVDEGGPEVGKECGEKELMAEVEFGGDDVGGGIAAEGDEDGVD